MAKNQSQRPGRDVRGGKGKSQTQAKGARGGKGAPQRGRGGQGGRGYQQASQRPEASKAPRRRGGAPQMGGGSWIEGRRAVVEALEVGMPLKRALVADSDGSLADIVRQLEEAGVPIERSSRSKLDAISSHGAHQGVVVQAAPFRYADLSDVIERAGEGDALVVLLDHVTDQGNLGAIVRSAEVVGAAGVVIANARAARVGVGAYKTSAGAVLHLPIAQVANLSRAVEDLKKAGFWVCGASEHAEQGIWNAPVEGRLALVMGSEGAGISQLLLEKCDFLAKLPQRGRIESLNVAQATTVFCYEWLRRTAADA
jgi:23S rRNA (guanosine2251-2'-O)-methyltransferase